MTNPLERTIKQQTLALLGTRTDLRIWNNPTGVGLSPSGHVIRFGLPGSPDLIGLMHDGTFLGIEVKSATGRQRPAQKNFQRMIESMNGVYLLVRSAEDALSQLQARGYCVST